MLNSALGSQQDIDGVAHLLVAQGTHGHALYGPYEQRQPGNYVVTFSMRIAGELPEGDWVCGFVDVSSHRGQRSVALKPFWMSEVRSGRGIGLHFSIDEAAELEYRVHVNGTAALLVADVADVERVDVKSGDVVPADRTPFAEVDGVKIFAATYDDIHFVDEIFYKKTYNMGSARDSCVLDIGMNVGLASLWFAKMPNVREVHAFEPFPDTYARALRNLTLNPALAAKVTPHAYGLGARDEHISVDVEGTFAETGGRNILGTHEGGSVRIEVRDAATALRPIIDSARDRGLQVILKVDCEGSEFEIFRSLAEAEMFDRVTAVVVEWHRVFPGKTQADLMRPLLDAGFIVIDLSPDEGNGFFYGVRPESAT